MIIDIFYFDQNLINYILLNNISSNHPATQSFYLSDIINIIQALHNHHQMLSSISIPRYISYNLLEISLTSNIPLVYCLKG